MNLDISFYARKGMKILGIGYSEQRSTLSGLGRVNPVASGVMVYVSSPRPTPNIVFGHQHGEAKIKSYVAIAGSGKTIITLVG